MKKSLKLVLLFLFPILLALFFLRNVIFKQSIAAWFDESWHYRKAIPVTNNAGGENNVYISVSIDTSDTGKFQEDCGDLRFTKYNGSLLPYYIVTGCGTDTTVIHVNFDIFPTGTQTIYYYYGNPSADKGFSPTDFNTQASNYTVGTLSSEEISKAPIAYWKFDEGTGNTVYDATSNKNNGTMSGATWQDESMCIAGKCLKFNGDKDSVNVGSSTPLNTIGTDDFTISGWFKIISHQSYNGLFTNKLITDNSKGIAIFSNSFGALNAKLGNGTTNTTSVIPAGKISPNQWYFITYVRQGSHQYLYLNAKLEDDDDTVTTYDISNSTVTRISNNTESFNGFIDEVKIYPYARSEKEIKADYNARGSLKGVALQTGTAGRQGDALNNGLVGYWNFDIGSGTSAPDLSGNGNTANFGIGDSAPGWDTGKYGMGASFDGENDYISTTLNNPTTAISVSAWIKPSDLTTGVYHDIITSGGIKFYTFGDNLYCYLYGPKGQAAKTNLNLNSWNFVTCTYDGKQVIVYINGVAGNPISLSGNMVSAPITIGKWYESEDEFFNGTIDEVRIYNRALSPAEVRKLYEWAPGPVAYWDFEEASGNYVYDKSGHGIGGTWNGTGTHWINGKYGKAGSFNGSDDYVNVGNHSQLKPTNTTISAWIKTNDATESQRIFGSINYYNEYTGLMVAASKIRFTTDNNNSLVSLGTVTSGKWYYITATYENGTRNIYINGNLSVGDTGVVPIDWGGVNYAIGASIAGDTAYFDGNIDEVKIYNYARTQKQIVEDMNAGHPAGDSPVGSMVAHYKFDEGYGTEVHNSGFGGSELKGNFGAGSSAPTWTNNGKFGKALRFDGNGCMSIDGRTTLESSTALTISTWIYPTTINNFNQIVNKRGSGTPIPYQFSLRNGGVINFGFYDTTWRELNSDAGEVAVNNWYHLVVTYNQGIGKLYKNGKLIKTSTSLPISLPSNTNYYVYTGCYNNNSEHFTGLIDEVKIYNYALTEEEVKIDYNRGAALQIGSKSVNTGSTAPSTAASQEYCVPGDTGYCAPPVAEWDFNENTNSTVYDPSGNNNNGSLGTGSSAPSWSVGPDGSPALKFDGNDYIETKDIDISGSFTLEAWVYTTNTKNKTIISKGGGTNANYCFDLRNNDNSPAFFVYDTEGKARGLSSATTQKVPTNQWVHIAGVYDSASTPNFRIYINGSQISNTANWTGTMSTNNVNTIIGARGTTSLFFNGKIDGIKIYDYTRTPVQIAWDYNRGAPTAHWKFNECQGNTVHDSSGNNLHGTINIGVGGSQSSPGTCTNVSANSAWYNGKSGKSSSSINFDGTDDWISLDTKFSLRDFTLSMWLYSKATDPNQATPFGDTANKDWIQIYDGEFTLSCNGNPLTSIPISVQNNTWEHWSVTRAGSTVKIFKNGREVASGTISDTFSPDAIARGGNRYYNGQIDEVRIYNYALTEEQVKLLYNEDSAVRFAN